MSINESEYRVCLDRIARALESMAGSEDMASVQINSGGNCILCVGLRDGRHMTTAEFAKLLDEAVTRDLEA